MQSIAKGIWKLTYGEPERFTPETFRRASVKTEAIECVGVSRRMGFGEDEILCRTTARGVTVTLPMDTEEDIYGFGLQLRTVNHGGRRRFLKVNSDPAADTGESHAPVPFYVSTGGYGVFVNTLRYATFFMGTHREKGASAHLTAENEAHREFSESAIYALKRDRDRRKVIIEIPAAKGIELFFFEGNVPEVVQRYNLFSGGGCIPPMWGLGMWYRSYGGSSEKEVLELAEGFRREGIPMDVIGLEPGWHSHSYSCTYKWSDLFPNHGQMTERLAEEGYKVNLWEHIYVHPMAPFYRELAPCTGDWEVWNGLVPDFATEEAERIFQEYHRDNFVRKGIAGFKLDECDNSDYNASNWGFPESAEFPSGMDGEQMHSAIGVLYQNLIYGIYRGENRRTYSQARSSGALAAPLPFVLYSDLYDHRQFIRGVVNAGFSGLLWCPEVRNCADGNDLLRRLQTVVFSGQALINGWRIPNPPWKQTDIQKNLAGEEMPEAARYTAECRKLFELRMSLLPYLYSAFVEYFRSGRPPIRALVLDYPEDENARNIDSQYFFGDSLMVCPLTYEDGTERSVYFPEGVWYDFFTGERVDDGQETEQSQNEGRRGGLMGEKAPGGRRRTVQADYTKIPVYVKENAIVPLAAPAQYVGRETVFDIEVRSFGSGNASFTLYEDDFTTFDGIKNQREILLERRQGQEPTVKMPPGGSVRYRIKGAGPTAENDPRHAGGRTRPV